MDTPREIAEEEYIRDHMECCATCHYWQKDGNRHCCMNLESIFAADWTDADDGCNRHVLKRNIHF